MNIAPILPIEGVPEELIRILNTRLRELSQMSAPDASTPDPPPVLTPSVPSSTGWVKVGTTAPALTAALPVVVAVSGIAADATYSANEIGLINGLVTFSVNMVTLTTNLRTRVNQLEAQVKALGFTK